MNIESVSESDIRLSKLIRLAQYICKDLKVSHERFYNVYARGEVSQARHLFVLVATDVGFSHPEVMAVLKRDPSFITQVRRRKQDLRKTAEYIHAVGFMNAINSKQQETMNAEAR